MNSGQKRIRVFVILSGVKLRCRAFAVLRSRQDPGQLKHQPQAGLYYYWIATFVTHGLDIGITQKILLEFFGARYVKLFVTPRNDKNTCVFLFDMQKLKLDNAKFFSIIKIPLLDV